MSRRKALQHEIDFRDRQTLIALVEKGRIRTDVGKKVMEELGFLVGMWNGGKSTRAVGLSITCGSYSTVRGIGRNCVLLDLPEELGDLQQWERVADVVVAVATSWEPDWAGVFAQNEMNRQKLSADVPLVDWMLYISKKLVADPRVPEALSIQPVNAIGWLVVVDEGPAEVDNSTHLGKVQAVEAALGIR